MTIWVVVGNVELVKEMYKSTTFTIILKKFSGSVRQHRSLNITLFLFFIASKSWAPCKACQAHMKLMNFLRKLPLYHAQLYEFSWNVTVIVHRIGECGLRRFHVRVLYCWTLLHQKKTVWTHKAIFLHLRS